jgi:hypothetical protein
VSLVFTCDIPLVFCSCKCFRVAVVLRVFVESDLTTGVPLDVVLRVFVESDLTTGVPLDEEAGTPDWLVSIRLETTASDRFFFVLDEIMADLATGTLVNFLAEELGRLEGEVLLVRLLFSPGVLPGRDANGIATIGIMSTLVMI